VFKVRLYRLFLGNHLKNSASCACSLSVEALSPDFLLRVRRIQRLLAGSPSIRFTSMHSFTGWPRSKINCSVPSKSPFHATSQVAGVTEICAASSGSNRTLYWYTRPGAVTPSKWVFHRLPTQGLMPISMEKAPATVPITSRRYRPAGGVSR
jgi:hypothetical protein